MHLLYFIRDPYPTNRPDVQTLFGERLLERGVSSDIVAMRSEGEQQSERRWPAGKEFSLSGRRGSVIDSLRSSIFDLRSLLRAGNQDTVVVRDKIGTAMLALAVRRRTRVYYWMSFPFPEEDLLRSRQEDMPRLKRLMLWLRGTITAWLLYTLVVPSASTVFVQSETMRDRVAQRSGRRAGIVSVPMGFDERAFPAAPPKRQFIEGERFRLGYIGTLDKARRIDFLLDVLVRLRAREPSLPIELVLIGGASTQSELAWLLQRIQKMGLGEQVRLVGELDRSQAWEVLSTCHLGVSAIPRGELFDVASPTKAVEYLGLGLPILVNDIPDQQGLVTRTGAGICVPMEIEAFALAVAMIRQDYDAYAQRSHDCRDWLVGCRGYGALADLVEATLRGGAR